MSVMEGLLFHVQTMKRNFKRWIVNNFIQNVPEFDHFHCSSPSSTLSVQLGIKKIVWICFSKMIVFQLNIAQHMAQKNVFFSNRPNKQINEIVAKIHFKRFSNFDEFCSLLILIITSYEYKSPFHFLVWFLFENRFCKSNGFNRSE